MSQLLERLRRDLDRQADAVERAETSARIACTLARLGRFDEARDVIAELRVGFGAGQSGRVTTWIMLAEGIVYHYQDLSPIALDRITRAQVLGEAMKYSAVVALAAAWRAHIEFERSQFSPMIRSLTTATANVDLADHDAQTRLAMVLSNAFMISGDREQGTRWFMRGREHAVKNGDQASIEALLYNRVAFLLAWLRVENCMSEIDPADLQRIRFEIASAQNLQDLTRISALASHVKLLNARLLILEGRYESAIAALTAVRSAAPFASHNFDQAFIDLEIDFCAHAMGCSSLTSIRGDELMNEKFADLDIDEQIIAAWMNWRLTMANDDQEGANARRSRLDELVAKYQGERSRLRWDLRAFELADSSC